MKLSCHYQCSALSTYPFSSLLGNSSVSSLITRWQCGNMKSASPSESKSYLRRWSHPVICGVMDIDWHYYRLIAPHSYSSCFEDQSARVTLCVPTLINPEWTSIKPTVHFVHLLLLTLFWAFSLNYCCTSSINCCVAFHVGCFKLVKTGHFSIVSTKSGV